MACVFVFFQVTMEFGLDKRAQTLQGLAFPLQEDAKRALQQLKQRRINYIQLVNPKTKLLCNQWIDFSSQYLYDALKFT